MIVCDCDISHPDQISGIITFSPRTTALPDDNNLCTRDPAP